jgi:hypothetical protein
MTTSDKFRTAPSDEAICKSVSKGLNALPKLMSSNGAGQRHSARASLS